MSITMSVGVALLLWANLSGSEAAKILFFTPAPAKSHHSVYRPIVRGLAEKGHEVHYYTPFPIEDGPESLKNVVIDTQAGAGESSSKGPLLEAMNMRSLTTLQVFQLGHSLIDAAVRTNASQALLGSAEHFDLVVTASSFGQESSSTLAHKFQAPMVQIIPVGDVSHLLETVGSPVNPAYMMNMFNPLSDRMSFFERISNTIDWLWVCLATSYVALTGHQRTVDKYMAYPGSETRPSVMEMTSNTALVLLNSHPSVGYAFPKASHVKEIGGINVVPSKPLPADLQRFLDSATDGAIYFSLGSIVQVSEVAGKDVRKAFVEAFGKLKQKVLWKWEAEDFPDKPPNVMTAKWFPQQDVLAHKNMKLFITQGGMMSLHESVSRGVPLLGIPFFGDQRKNLMHGTTRGYAVVLEYENLTEHSIKWALDELLFHPSYKREAERRSKLFHDRPMKPLDEAIYWIEYVIRHGDVLRPRSSALPLYQLYLLDVLAFCIAVLVVTVKLGRIAIAYGKSAIFESRKPKIVKTD